MANFSESVGAFWIKKSKTGIEYFSGVLELEKGKKINVVMFKNNKKESDNQPDFRLFKSESKPQEVASQNISPATTLPIQPALPNTKTESEILGKINF